MNLSEQGVRPGSINMARILRHLRYRSDQSRRVVYHRPPIYDRDSYGVETTTINTEEILIPSLSALIRPTVTADYQLQKQGNNVIGAARVYTPNIETIKNFPNFDQTVGQSNIDFNEIEGWDRFIDVSRNVYTVTTNATTNWTSGSADATFSSDGQTLTAELGTDYEGTLEYALSPAVNTLEADRIRFDIKASGASNIELTDFRIFNSGTSGDGNKDLVYAPTSLSIPTGSWLTVDVPFVSGTQVGSTPVASGTSIYSAGNRYAVTVTSGASWDYEANMEQFRFNISGAASGNKVYFKGIRFYKSLSWHVHSTKELNTDYMIFNCVRTTGARDTRRRAYSD